MQKKEKPIKVLVRKVKKEEENVQKLLSTQKQFKKKKYIWYCEEDSLVNGFQIICAGSKGKLHDNEDRVCYGKDGDRFCMSVTDGHGSYQTAQIVSNNLVLEMLNLGNDVDNKQDVENVFQKVDILSLQEATDDSGACATVFTVSQGKFWVANVGDCSCFALLNDDKVETLTEDHSTFNKRLLEDMNSRAEVKVEIEGSYFHLPEARLGLQNLKAFGEREWKNIGKLKKFMKEPSFSEKIELEKLNFAIVMSDGLIDGIAKYLFLYRKDKHSIQLLKEHLELFSVIELKNLHVFDLNMLKAYRSNGIIDFTRLRIHMRKIKSSVTTANASKVIIDFYRKRKTRHFAEKSVVKSVIWHAVARDYIMNVLKNSKNKKETLKKLVTNARAHYDDITGALIFRSDLVRGGA